MLIKKRRPDWEVSVIEQNAASSTFGFGVVLADSGLNRLQAADPGTHERLVGKMTFTGCQTITQKEPPISIKHPSSGGAIARIDLLTILQSAAAAAGVDVRYGVRVDHPDELGRYGLDDADVVIGADGVNSVVRTADETGFGTTRSNLTNRFSWFGTSKVFTSSALVFRQYRGGAFVAHYYPYCANGSTFVAECDNATWLEFGMDGMSADQRQALFEEVFAAELDGHRLISNNSAWRQFPVIRNRNWSTGKHVLIGDAQTSAHFSIGSGTRIAMEDAIALADALTLVVPGSPDPSFAERLQRFS
ncbi:MAG: FAD-dependent monooxygenase, partial [Pseudomonadota bacterium]